MFDLVFSGFSAFYQVMLLIGALLFLALGLGLLFNALYWRLRGQRVEGTVIGVRSNGKTFRTVYRYMLPSGEEHEAMSDMGTSRTEGRETGRVVRLMVFPDKPDEVRETGNYFMGIFGVVFAAPGFFMLSAALSGPTTPMFFVVFAGVIAYLALKLRGAVIPKGQRLSPEAWMAWKRKTRQEEIAASPVLPIEDMMKTPEMRKKDSKERASARFAVPVLLLMGLGMLWGGLYFGSKTWWLQKEGLRAEGQVVGLKESRTDDGTTWRAVVSFSDASGAVHRFEDSVSSSPAMYGVGEPVGVLYVMGSAGDTAAIDRGYFNWALPGGLAVGGMLFVFLSLGALRRWRTLEEVR